MKNLLPYLIAGLSTVFTAGCSSKKEDAMPKNVAPSATYTLDGRATIATGVSIRLLTAPSPPVQSVPSIDRLSIIITADPASTSSEIVNIQYAKAPGASDNTYTAYSLEVGNSTRSPSAGYYNAPMALTLAKNADGSWSGTFAGGMKNSVGVTTHTLSAGVFTGLKP